MSFLQCQAIQLLKYLYQDHYPFLYKWPFTLDKKTHFLVLLRDTRRGVPLLRKLAPTLVLLIMSILSILDLYVPFPHNGTPEEDKALFINQTVLSLGNDEVIMKSKLWVSVFVATMELCITVTAFCTFFLHLDDIVHGTNCIIKLYNKFHPWKCIRRNSTLDTSFRANLVNIYNSIKRGDDILGSVLIAFISSGWIIITPSSVVLTLFNLDPLVHLLLYTSKKYKPLSYIIQFLYDYLGAIPIVLVRYVFTMLTWYELARIVVSILTMGILWVKWN
ncbi:hypothetical protein Fcan01_20655 [Folsomia candida]|uniref:Uncharacterized protein n=1 Tax=Folsomia candida TaxID=158441 RepID=A0A226DK36_FOLCA|nr:hypothetical protein Fcan01_20655 [Folsomia candida]